MRALVLTGFCISPCVHAEVGQVVDLPDGLFREMLQRGSIKPAPPEKPAKAEPAAEPAPVPKSKT